MKFSPVLNSIGISIITTSEVNDTNGTNDLIIRLFVSKIAIMIVFEFLKPTAFKRLKRGRVISISQKTSLKLQVKNKNHLSSQM